MAMLRPFGKGGQGFPPPDAGGNGAD